MVQSSDQIIRTRCGVMVQVRSERSTPHASNVRPSKLELQSAKFQKRRPTGRSAAAATLVHSSTHLTTAGRAPLMTSRLKPSEASYLPEGAARTPHSLRGRATRREGTLTEGEAEDLGGCLRAHDAVRVLEQRLLRELRDDVERREVPIDLCGVAELELTRLMRHHVTHCEDVGVASELQLVVDDDRVAEAEGALERGVLEHLGVGQHSDALVHHARGQHLA
mmetsp:Transcript_34401/g.83671  ORF Transcript_34401/g.83671 Transcript_34401/m.83671 type:complete len:222 (-) Transcript_34401:9-674(-)